jgi:hypothetical protein
MSSSARASAGAVVALLATACFQRINPELRSRLGEGLGDPAGDTGLGGEIAGAEEGGDAGMGEGDAPLSGQLSLEVTGNLDDGEIELSGGEEWAVDGEGGTIYMGYWTDPPTDGRTWGYHRFALTGGIPAGASVTDARLVFWVTDAAYWDLGQHLEVFVEDTADASLVDELGDYPGGASGTAFLAEVVRWPAAGGLSVQAGAPLTSPDLSRQLQQLVDAHGGLAQGAHVQLWVSSDDASGNCEVGIEDYSATSVKTVLTIDWQR